MSALPVPAGGPDVDWVVARYESVRARLPTARFPRHGKHAANLAAVAERFDAFVLDAFGVLNVGDAPVPGAPQAVAALQGVGRAVLVLTNGATLPAASARAKYRRLGFEFSAEAVISSRDLLERALAAWPARSVWGFSAPPLAGLDSMPVDARALGDDAALYEQADGFVLLSTHDWNDRRQSLLRAALLRRPRPLLVGNPDVVAPREQGFSIEPGEFAHALADELGIEPVFFGKPHANAFDEVQRRLALLGLPGADPRRVAMVGDSLHTDILGGAAAGLSTVLVAGHGLFAGRDPRPYIEATGIVPDVIVETT